MITPRSILSRWRLFALAGVVVLAGAVKGYEFTHNQGYQPTQPIAFSHKLHAGQLGMDCLYCHTSAEKSRHATVPAVESCMGCHSVVRTDRPEIQKLKAYYDKGEPVPWVRIHSLPDHAYFNHAQHVAAGVACQTCHGNIQEMEIVEQAVNLSMGWCMSCHRNDEYVKTPESVATQQEMFVNAHSFYRLEGGKLPAVDKMSLKEKYADWREQAGYWTASDLDAMDKDMTLGEMGGVVAKALGYNNLAPQTGPGAIDHIKAFQNASVNCNTCHN